MHISALTLSFFKSKLKTPKSWCGEKSSPFPKFITTFFSLFEDVDFFLILRENTLHSSNALHSEIGQPVGMRPDDWSQHPASKRRSVQMFCCNTGPQTSHTKLFQPELHFTLCSQKPTTTVSNPQKAGRGCKLRILSS